MRKLIFGLAALGLIGSCLLLPSCRARSTWSTGSPAALAEFEQGLDDLMKFYREDAAGHFQKALEIDPEFAAARVMLLETTGGGERREQLLEELRNTDPAGLSDRERFLVEYGIAIRSDQPEGASDLLDDYRNRYPTDPFALSICSRRAWDRQEFDQAERLYRQLLESNPNWVIAQNSLGYLAMARGEFEHAEELFRTYAYIAPDQANPHDSLGELLTLVGRYEEARGQLEQALEIKRDFCASYKHLMLVAVMEGLPPDTEQIDRRAAEVCDPEFAEALRCERQLWNDFFSGDWEAPWGEDRSDCRELVYGRHHLYYQMALGTGRRAEADAMEERLRANLEKAEGGEAKALVPRAYLLHLEGYRSATEGAWEAAADRFAQADKLLVYWGDGQGVMKLYNRLYLAAALERAGHPDKAEAMMEQVREVNPGFAEVREEIARGFGGEAVPAPSL